MRTLTILGVGFVLGATLGFGGMYNYVLKPAKDQILELEKDNKVMEGALVEAQTVLEEEAKRISVDYLPEFLPAIGLRSIESIKPSETVEPLKTKKTETSADDKKGAIRLMEMAKKLRAITAKK